MKDLFVLAISIGVFMQLFLVVRFLISVLIFKVPPGLVLEKINKEFLFYGIRDSEVHDFKFGRVEKPNK